jgi:hypothetical protein
MLLFERFRLAVFGFKIGIDLSFVCIVVGKRSMNLGERQVTEIPYDLFGNHAHVMPLSNPANRDTCTGNARPTAPDLRAAGNQATNLGDGWHRFQV